MIKRILYIVNLVFVLLLLGVYAGVRVSPEFIAELSLFSYIYPLLLVVNVLFKPRTWCSFCPMGTMTQMICKIKAREKL